MDKERLCHKFGDMCHPEYKKTKEEGGGEEEEELPPALPDGIVGTKVLALLALLVHKTQVRTDASCSARSAREGHPGGG